MVKVRIRSILIILTLITLNLSTYSQNRKYFVITGKVVNETTPDEKINIEIVKNDKKLITSEIASHGRFRLELDYNSEYQLTFSQNGHTPKTIVVNTAVPEEVMIRQENFPNFLMAVKLSDGKQEQLGVYPNDEKQQIAYFSQIDGFARIQDISGVEYVVKNNPASNRALQSLEGKSKLQVYQVF